ncbi:hypothetical protein BJ912DRAFT_1043314 [Pholiota molesta]|nr:hypothetical protein BJ912DRAFT_1043314 [Pholiota molesta]
MDPFSNVEFFTGAKNFNIRNGRFRTIAGNSYTGYHPPPASPPQERPPMSSRTSFFSKSSNFEIGGGEFAAINGDSFDIPQSFDTPGPSLNDGYNDPNHSDSVPQTIGGQSGLDVPEQQALRELPEDIGQIRNVPDYTRMTCSSTLNTEPLIEARGQGQETLNMTPARVDVAQAINDAEKSSSSPGIMHPENTDQWNPPRGQTSQAVHPHADVVVEPTLLTSPMSYKTTPAQSNSSGPVPIGDEGIPAVQGRENVLQFAEPRSYSENPNYTDTSPYTLLEVFEHLRRILHQG